MCQSFLLQHCSVNRMSSGWAPQRGYGLSGMEGRGPHSDFRGQQAVDTGVSAQHQASSFKQPAWVVVWCPINPITDWDSSTQSVGSMRKLTELSSRTGPSHQLRKEHTVQPGPMERQELGPNHTVLLTGSSAMLRPLLAAPGGDIHLKMGPAEPKGGEKLGLWLGYPNPRSSHTENQSFQWIMLS